jgi:hypothetical protein
MLWLKILKDYKKWNSLKLIDDVIDHQNYMSSKTVSKYLPYLLGDFVHCGFADYYSEINGHNWEEIAL